MSKGSGGSQTQTVKQEPYIGQQPYLLDLYSKAQALPTQQFYPGQTFASPSDLTFQAEQLAQQAALGPQTTIAGSIIPSIQEQLMSPAQRFSDPLLQESLRAGLRPMEESASRLLQQARRDATGAGQLGGTRQGILESEVIKDLLTKQSDVASRLYGDVYGDTLSSQSRALAFAPSAMSTLMQPSATLANIAAAQTARAQQPITEAMQRFAFEQAAPGQALDRYANIAAGTIIPGTQTTTGPGAQSPGFAAGALGGAGLGSLIPYTAPVSGIFGTGATLAPGMVGPTVKAGALAGFNPYILGGALLGGLFS
tara:strand:+ start:2287 stop:3219 length:933 start_codon:yes stop_codon:yes gene_type:complete